MAPRHFLFRSLAAGLALSAAAAGAQLLPQTPLPPVGDVLGGVDRTGRDLLDSTDATLGEVRTSARSLARARIDRLDDLVRANRERLEMTDLGPAVRGEVIAIDPSQLALTALARAGFTQRGEETLEDLGIRTVTFAVPRGWSVDRALSRLRRIAPDTEFAANHLHLQSGADAALDAAVAMQGRASGRPAVGIVDGGVASHPALTGPIQQRGFVSGAPRASTHGTAVASLVAGQGVMRSAAPGAPLYVADIYGADPAGGNALALSRALAWLAGQRVRVVAVSLVGPANPLVARTVAQARARGMHIVAAVGNDGPAAPPAFPASYPGVIAVTGIDGRGRVLIEAGRASHLDYAAPGADMAAAGPGGLVAVRGTSYAVPLVAGRLAHHLGARNPIAALDAEAQFRGRRGLGRGIICGDCRTIRRR